MLQGLTALHLAVSQPEFQADILRLLLKSGADLTLKTPETGSTVFHLAVEKECGDQILRIIAEERGKPLPLSVTDANDETPFAKALLNGFVEAPRILLRAGGADVNEVDRNGVPLLLRAIAKKHDNAAVFLLKNGADPTVRMPESKNCLELAVECGLLETVRCLCKSGANLDWRDPLTGLPPLWSAVSQAASELICLIRWFEILCWWKILDSFIGSFDVAAVLVEHGCDTNGWAYSDDRTYTQTLLHRAIDLNLTDAAIFLIQKDRYGASALGLAMQKRYNQAAEAIVQKAPHAVMQKSDSFDLSFRRSIKFFIVHSLQMNGSGENLLHSAVRSGDLESVLFLLALQIDVNVLTQDASRVTALHLCAQTGSEMILRNLILAGAEVNATSAKGFTPLHVAAYNNHEALCVILMENGAFPNLIDQEGNTPLHAAVLQGSVSAVNVLLGNPEVNARAINKRQQTPLILAAGTTAASNSLDILQMFLSHDPEYPIDAPDSNGNTLFLLAYMNGNSELCKAVLRYGVCMGVTNNFGVSRKQFKYGHILLDIYIVVFVSDSLEREPRWADGDTCSECGNKFTLTMRKHHCR
ncbi:unnamed protein product [Anisakis simplex]|uniref:ANK_REP_REGION domain-containing protein n=1 Tax=Anisakis simplex TaxID=6269 RepID=A0A0M3KAZ4_ANISI|nr:unnamed protein product [Anisakis simplex]